MPKLEINVTQPWLTARSGNVAEIIGKFDGADQLHSAMRYREITLRHYLRRTRDLLLPRLLSDEVNLDEN